MSTRTQFQPSCFIAEMKEFAGFSEATQRYIRRSLDVAEGGREAAARWSRTRREAVRIRAQARVYGRLEHVRRSIPDDIAPDAVEPMIGPLVAITGFDLGEGFLPDFASYRFLYERLIGPEIRPWLPGAFCGAATFPHLHPGKRRALLDSISEAAATAPGWSGRAPHFFPEWIDKVRDDCAI